MKTLITKKTKLSVLLGVMMLSFSSQHLFATTTDLQLQEQASQLQDSQLENKANQQLKELLSFNPHEQKPAQKKDNKRFIVTAKPLPADMITAENNATIQAIKAIKVPSTLSLEQAQQYLLQVSPKLAAEHEKIESRKWQRKAVDSIDNPLVFARASAAAYKMREDLDLTDTQDAVVQGIGNVHDKALGAIGVPLPSVPQIPVAGNYVADKIPDTYSYSKSGQSVSAGLGVVVPLFTKSRVSALEHVLDARTLEADAESTLATSELQTKLVERYFDYQLATLFLTLSDDAVITLTQTDHMAERLYEEGFISLVDRMQMQTALENAKSDNVKMQNIYKLSSNALQSLLRTEKPIRPTTPLFISTKPLKELTYYQEVALKNHAGFKIVAAKREQAKSLYRFSDNDYKPRVSMFGYVDVHEKPSWFAGISATWTFTGGIDKSAMRSSNRAKVRQADLSAVELEDNIRLLVEKHWHDVQNAQARFKALQSNVDLSAKVFKLRKRGLEAGVNTAVEVVQAQTQYLKATTEQAQAVNDFVKSLAQLMHACGTPLEFNNYMYDANVLLANVEPHTDWTEK